MVDIVGQLPNQLGGGFVDGIIVSADGVQPVHDFLVRGAIGGIDPVDGFSQVFKKVLLLDWRIVEQMKNFHGKMKESINLNAMIIQIYETVQAQDKMMIQLL